MDVQGEDVVAGHHLLVVVLLHILMVARVEEATGLHAATTMDTILTVVVTMEHREAVATECMVVIMAATWTGAAKGILHLLHATQLVVETTVSPGVEVPVWANHRHHPNEQPLVQGHRLQGHPQSNVINVACILELAKLTSTPTLNSK